LNQWSDFLWYALAGGIGVVLLAGPLGCFVVWQRLAYFGETLAHGAFLGVALAFLLDLSPTLGVAAVGVALAFLLARRSANEPLTEDTLLGFLAHTSLALGLVALAFLERVRVDLFAYLFGDILALRPEELLLLALIDLIGLVLVVRFWSGWVNLTLHEELAAVEGHPVTRLRLVFLLTLALFVATAMKLVGILLTVALLVIPAAAARPLSRTPTQMAIGAVLIGVVAVWLGLSASLAWDTPAGPSIVVAAALLFLLVRWVLTVIRHARAELATSRPTL
jgi:zinc transport system permease protein